MGNEGLYDGIASIGNVVAFSFITRSEGCFACSDLKCVD